MNEALSSEESQGECPNAGLLFGRTNACIPGERHETRHQ